MEKLVLIDGNSLINRAFYAMPVLSTKNGEYTNAVYGFMNMLFKIFTDIEPEYMAVAFDLKAPTFRHNQYSEYKATRKPMPLELRPQIPLLKELLRLMNISVIEQEGIEADDIIGTIAKNTDVLTYIFTGDKDSFQLVDHQTEVHFTRRGISDVEIYTQENFFEKTGINPSQIIDLKSLMGDASDNIPGVAGVGEKTALTLVQKYGSLDGVYSNLHEITGKLKEKLIDNKITAYLSYNLATIKTDCLVDCNVNNMRVKTPFSFKAKQRFLSLEFKSPYLKNEKFFLEQISNTSDNTQEISKENELKNDLETFKPNIIKVVELEQISSLVNSKNNDIKEFSLAIDSNFVNLYDGTNEYLIEIRQSLLDNGFNLSQVLHFIKPIFNQKSKVIVFSKKALCHLYLDILGEQIDFNAEDLSIIKYLADYTGRGETLKSIIEEYSYSYSTPAFSTYCIFNKLKNKLASENNLDLYYKVELPLADVLFDMEVTGFKVDYDSIVEIGKKYQKILSELEKEIRIIAEDDSLNVNSPKQLGYLLFDKLKLSKGKKNRTGYSTSVEVLEKLEDIHPIISKILKYRQIQKLHSTYIEGLKPLVDRKEGIIKTSFNQTVTSTGRLSSKEPNLQNIPVREEEGKELRKFFVARDADHILIGADYSQIELRLLAAFSNCGALINAFNSDVDVHKVTASKVFNVEVDRVTPQMRSSAKAVNFGIIYGISEYGLAKNIKVTPARARELISAYFNEYPQVKEYMNANVDFARKNGYAVTYLGRRRYIKEINSAQFNTRQFGERAAMNMPLQGSSADIIKLAMIGVYNRIKKQNLKSKLILQIHDELIVDALLCEQEEIKNILKQEMENAVNLSVKLSVNLASGKNWFEAK